MSILSQYFGLKTVILTKEIFLEYSKEIIKLVSEVYIEREIGSKGLSYEEIAEEVESDFLGLFSENCYNIVSFLYFDTETDELIGNFMLWDAYKFYLKCVERIKLMSNTEKSYDYDEKLIKNLEEGIKKYNIGPGECVYGTKFAFKPHFFKKIQSKGFTTIQMIKGFMIDYSELMVKMGIRRGMWVQFKPNLILSTKTINQVDEEKEFNFIGGDKILVEGKFLSLVFDKERLIKNRVALEEELKMKINLKANL